MSWYNPKRYRFVRVERLNDETYAYHNGEKVKTKVYYLLQKKKYRLYWDSLFVHIRNEQPYRYLKLESAVESLKDHLGMIIHERRTVVDESDRN